MHRISSIAFPSFAAICGFAVAQADAAVIGIDDFSGDESMVTFDDPFTKVWSKSFGDVTIEMVNGSDSVMVSDLFPDLSVFFENLSDYSGGHAAVSLGQTPSFLVKFADPVVRAGLALSNLEDEYNWTVGAYDVNGQLLQEEEFQLPSGTLSLFAGFDFDDATRISWLKITDDGGSGQYATNFDDVRYEMPEPGTLALVGLGTALMLNRRRQR